MQARTADVILQGCGLLRGMDDAQRDVLKGLSVTRGFQPGEHVFSQDDECPGLFIVDQGLIRVFRLGAQGQQHVLHLCGPGQTFAEVAAFGNFAVPASAVAIQSSTCLMIPTDLLQRELASNHELCRQLLIGMSGWVRHFVLLLDDIVLRDAIGRVARYLSDAPCEASGYLKLAGPKKDIANHLNLTSETFSRVLRRLSDRGILHLSGDGEIQVVDGEKLTEIGL
ncbi:MAG: Crp/Fnr family transcriptional regulator [Pirellulaceae bacterium]